MLEQKGEFRQFDNKSGLWWKADWYENSVALKNQSKKKFENEHETNINEKFIFWW